MIVDLTQTTTEKTISRWIGLNDLSIRERYDMINGSLDIPWYSLPVPVVRYFSDGESDEGKRVRCPVCAARFKHTHVCRKLSNHPCITREWALNPPKKYRKANTKLLFSIA